MGLRFMPREEKFFDMFSQQAANVVVGAKLLKELLDDYTDIEQKRMLIEKTESAGDEITHKILEKLNSTFITPMDREDIQALTSALDDILDFVNATAQRLHLYGVTFIPPDAKELAGVIVRASEETATLIDNLKNLKNVACLKAGWIEVNRLENAGDVVSRHAIAGLFKNVTDPIEVIKWKELYEHMETAIDKCEDAANIVETVCLKSA